LAVLPFSEAIKFVLFGVGYGMVAPTNYFGYFFYFKKVSKFSYERLGASLWHLMILKIKTKILNERCHNYFQREWSVWSTWFRIYRKCLSINWWIYKSYVNVDNAVPRSYKVYSVRKVFWKKRNSGFYDFTVLKWFYMVKHCY
jgi:hypothetical protein